MSLLRQSTAQVIRFGPFLDATDGVTPETGLTITQADMQLSKDGGAFAQKVGASSAVHDVDGWYSVTLNANDVDTNGILIMQVTVAGSIPYWKDTYDVVTAASYDAFTTNGLNNISTAQVNTECDTALTDYDGPTNAEMDARTLLAANYSTASQITALNDLSAAQVNAEVVDVMFVDTTAEPTSVPTSTASLAAKIIWTYTLGRNKLTQTSTTQTLRNDADSSDIATAMVSDDTVTFIRNEFT